MLEYVERLIKNDHAGSSTCTVTVTPVPEQGYRIIVTHKNQMNKVTDVSILDLPTTDHSPEALELAKQKAQDLIDEKTNLGFSRSIEPGSLRNQSPILDLKDPLIKKARIIGFECEKALNWVLKTSSGKIIHSKVQAGITVSNAFAYLGRMLVVSKPVDENASLFTTIGFEDHS